MTAGPGQVGFASTSGPVAAVFDVALLDLDGVVYVGPDAVPHAADALDVALSEHGMRAVFVTNNAARPPAVVADHLVSLGLRARPADVVTSAQAGARVLAERLAPGSRVLAVGGPGVPWALAERGLVPVDSMDDEPVAVMQGYGPEVGWPQLAEASLALDAGLPWVATNVDRTIPSPRGRVLGNGALVAALQYATGVVPLVAGKPEPPLMLESVERAGAAHPIVVGDRLDTDIEGANRSGIAGMLVLTGVTDWTDLLGIPAQLRPAYLAHDLRGLLEPAPAVQVTVEATSVSARCGEATVRVEVESTPHDTGAVRARTSGADRPEAGARDAGARGVDAADAHAPAARGVDPTWWVPATISRARGGLEADLDQVRAVVAASWAMVDAGCYPVRPAALSVTR